MKTINELVLSWADEKGLLKKENAIAQTVKLLEESGELAGAILKNNREDIIDAIGDIQVVLIILSEQLRIDYEDALDIAYATIRDRKGKMINGSFVKDKT
jgi:NTP pyrophosphatase (non-canonical NTP hydrolase)